MTRFENKVVFITGAARGQGRTHALRLAEEGADVIALDLCDQIGSVPYAMGTSEDLDLTVKEVERLGRRAVGLTADVRDLEALQAAFERGVEEIGPVDVVIANAGIAPMSVHHDDQQWHDALAVNLTGVYHTVRVAAPRMVARARGGAIVLTSSTAGLIGIGGNSPGLLGYTASKHGVVGLMRSFANCYAEHGIRVNSVHPSGVNTPMIVNEAVGAYFESDPKMAGALANAMPVPMIEPQDVSDAVAWLASDEARYVTGVALPVDAGHVNRR
ncbi:mycofactocin-coupled SDR family oxidoreductase [Nocardioides sp. NPDC051685]|uniref:mycofactocin-coupled SDR family oxidoreductase n=1 Tax=Nocardioides sp. NPDC051685 TaxID=3364334 RepID=UPI0037B1CA1D